MFKDYAPKTLTHESIQSEEIFEHAPPLSLDETNTAQREIMRLMGSDPNNDAEALAWIEEHSSSFRILVNGYDGPFDEENDTKEASANRKLFRVDQFAFYFEMKQKLVEHH